MSEVTKTYKKLRKELDDLRKQYLKAGKEAFKEHSKELFDRHPKMKEYSWCQYTPYFNDGEPCTFRANTSDPDINGVDWWTQDDDTGMTEEEWKTAANDVSEFLSSFDDDTLEHIFGDHVRVVVTKKGAKAEEYYHD